MGKRVFRNEATRTVNFTGALPQAPENLEYVIEDGKVKIKLRTSPTFFFKVRWERIADKDGNTFNSLQEIENYLTQTFAPFTIFGGHIIT